MTCAYSVLADRRLLERAAQMLRVVAPERVELRAPHSRRRAHGATGWIVTEVAAVVPPHSTL